MSIFLESADASGELPLTVLALIDNEVHLRSGIFVKEEQWAWLLSRPKDSLFCKEATKLLCSILELQNKNPTVAPCRRLVRQEDKRATGEGPDTKKVGGCG
ncbi:uncharacterized protein LOC125756759 [Rhipicephalus sanguineus]|uniref:uncharacterized protein LOC125756759 n=1 Tax=Rhipicephalus sanguineus TaxID=34632 RepID=UPI0020C25035|nr:uncharacterized protein LOC125756759 [Rhipicephalus sanguineus]